MMRRKAKDPSVDLYDAVQVGDVDKVKKCLSKGGSVYYRCPTAEGNTALHTASRFGHLDICKILFQNGANEYQKNEKGNTPLHLAAKHNHADIAALLCNRGADLDEENEYNSSPLHLAARAGAIQTTEYLLSKGSDLDLRESYSGGTPLHGACAEGREGVVALMLKADRLKDLSKVNFFGDTPLMLAAKAGHAATCKLLLMDRSRKQLFFMLGMANEGGETPFHAVSRKGNMDILTLLLDSMNGRNGFPPGNKLSKIKQLQLLDKKTVEDGRTAFHEAAWQGNSSITSMLAKLGCNVSQTDFGGRTILHLGAERGHHKMLVPLLVPGPGSLLGILNDRDNGGSTALHKAAIFGKEHACRVLVQAGAKLDIINNDGRTALYHAVLCNRVSTAAFLIDKKANVNLQTPDGNTVMHKCAYSGDVGTLLKLIAAGAPLNNKNRAGQTPLDIATERRRKHVRNILTDLVSRNAPSPPPREMTEEYFKTLSPPGSPRTFRLSPPSSPSDRRRPARSRFNDEVEQQAEEELDANKVGANVRIMQRKTSRGRSPSPSRFPVEDHVFI